MSRPGQMVRHLFPLCLLSSGDLHACTANGKPNGLHEVLEPRTNEGHSVITMQPVCRVLLRVPVWKR